MIVLASILVGIVSALAAIVLKSFVHLMHAIQGYFIKDPGNHLLYVILPVTGILLTVLVVRIFFKGKLEKGLGSILFSVMRKSGRVEKHKMYSHIINNFLRCLLPDSCHQFPDCSCVFLQFLSSNFPKTNFLWFNLTCLRLDGSNSCSWL